MKHYSLKVAVIDDGINENLYNNGSLENNIEITYDNRVIERQGYDPYLISHGTTCAAIIKKYAPKARLSSIKILNAESHKGNVEQLIIALRWCIDNGFKLINMSLGTTQFQDFSRIKKIIEEIKDKGIIVVAACNNRNIYTYPASHKDIIGVKCDISDNLKEAEFIYNENSIDGIDITSCSRHSINHYIGHEVITGMSNSHAAPMITAIVYNLMVGNSSCDINMVRDYLRNISIKKSVEAYNDFAFYPTFIQKEIINETKDDCPIIALYNSNLNILHEATVGLSKLFINDGYNAICISTANVETTEDDSIICIDDYIRDNTNNNISSSISSNTNNTISINKSSIKKSNMNVRGKVIDNIIRIYEPDITLIATNELSFLYQLDMDYDIDIKITWGIYNNFSGIKETQEPVFICLSDMEFRTIEAQKDKIAHLYKKIITLYQ